MSINIVRLHGLLEATARASVIAQSFPTERNLVVQDALISTLRREAIASLPELLKIAKAAVEWAKWGRDDSDDEHELLKAVREAFA